MYKILKRPPLVAPLSRDLNLVEGEWDNLESLTPRALRVRSLLLNTTVLDISHLAEFENLLELAVSEFCTGGFDLAALTKLETLWVDVGLSRPIQPGGGEELVHLGLGKATSPWSDWIQALPKLESLRLDQPRSLPLNLPSTLRRLEISGGRRWSEKGLSLTGGDLRELHLIDMRGMTDLASFCFADNLQILWLEDCPELRSLTGPGLGSDTKIHMVGRTPRLEHPSRS